MQRSPRPRSGWRRRSGRRSSSLDSSSSSARLILASSSPRRRQILEALGLPFDIEPADVDETPRPGEAPENLAARLAVAKATVAAERFPGRLAIGSDTVVALEGESLG